MDHLVMRRLDGAGIEGPLALYGAGFAEWLIGQGYAKSSVSHHLGSMGWLSRWLAEQDLAADALSEVVVHRFRGSQATGRPEAIELGAATAADVSSWAWGGCARGADDGRVATAMSAGGL
jgi:hypothetical protein